MQAVFPKRVIRLYSLRSEAVDFCGLPPGGSGSEAKCYQHLLFCFPQESVMHSVLTAAAFLLMVIAPCIVASRAGATDGE